MPHCHLFIAMNRLIAEGENENDDRNAVEALLDSMFRHPNAYHFLELNMLLPAHNNIFEGAFGESIGLIIPCHC